MHRQRLHACTHTHVRTYIAYALYACTRVCMDAKKDLAFEIPVRPRVQQLCVWGAAELGASFSTKIYYVRGDPGAAGGRYGPALDPEAARLRRAQQIPQRRPVAGDKEADTRSGQRADAHVRPRAPPRGPSPEEPPSRRRPGLRVCQVGPSRSPLPPPAAAAFCKNGA